MTCFVLAKSSEQLNYKSKLLEQVPYRNINLIALFRLGFKENHILELQYTLRFCSFIKQ